MKHGNVLDLCSYRRARFPSHEEIMEHLTDVQAGCDPLEGQIAENLLLMYECGMLKVTRDARGEFLYALQNEDAVGSGGSGAVQDIGPAPEHDGLAEGLCPEESPGRDL
jgi:hypothetical protein